MNLGELQSRISQAILGRKPYGDDLKINGGEKAFAIYRNNIFVSLTNSLRSLYPQTALLCGDDFADKARTFIQSEAPKQAHLFRYGESFPDFISAEFPNLKHVAAYERLCNLSYGAEQQEILTAEAFLQYEEEVRLDLDVRLSQACFIMQDLPCLLAESLCEETTTNEILLLAKEQKERKAILITRHENSVLSLPIEEDEVDFLCSVGEGDFASALMRFIEANSHSQNRLATFFALSVFRLN